MENTQAVQMQTVKTFGYGDVELPVPLVELAKEEGSEWGHQEYSIFEDMNLDAENPRQFPDWTDGNWCGDTRGTIKAALTEATGQVVRPTDDQVEEWSYAVDVIRDDAAGEAWESHRSEYGSKRATWIAEMEADGEEER
jgi:hypothetical protein